MAIRQGLCGTPQYEVIGGIQDDGSWNQREFNDLDAVVKLVSLDCELPLRETYEDLNFGTPAITLRPHSAE